MCNQSNLAFIVGVKTSTHGIDSASWTDQERNLRGGGMFWSTLFLCFFPRVFFSTDLFSFSKWARVHCSCSLSWCSRLASSMCCPHGESWSRAGLEWRRRYWSSSLSPPHRRQHTEPPAAQSRAKDGRGGADGARRGVQHEGRYYRGETRSNESGRSWMGHWRRRFIPGSRCDDEKLNATLKKLLKIKDGQTKFYWK